MKQCKICQFFCKFTCVKTKTIMIFKYNVFCYRKFSLSTQKLKCFFNTICVCVQQCMYSVPRTNINIHKLLLYELLNILIFFEVIFLEKVKICI